MDLFFAEILPETKAGILSVDESKHVRVLRKKNLDTLNLINGLGWLFEAKIVGEKKSQFLFEVTKASLQPKTDAGIGLLCAPLKQESRMEWLIEKGTELGCSHFILVETERAEKSFTKLERLQKIMVAALKQSQQYYFPKLSSFPSIQIALQTIQNTDFLVAHCSEKPKTPLMAALKNSKSPTLCIGPEGDFTDNELALFEREKAIFVTLGEIRLRSETAAIMGLSSHKAIQL